VAGRSRRRAAETQRVDASRAQAGQPEDLDAAPQGDQQLNLVIKGDNSGTVEALEDALMKLDVGDDVVLRVIDRRCRGITRPTWTWRSRPTRSSSGSTCGEGKVSEQATREGIDIRYYTVIYQAIDEIEQALKGLLKPEFRRSSSAGRGPGHLPASRVGMIAGWHGVVRRDPAQRQGPHPARRVVVSRTRPSRRAPGSR